MHPERLIMEINPAQNYISDNNFHFDHKAVRSNLIFWASLAVPGITWAQKGPLFRVARGLAGGINRICVLHTYEDVHTDHARFRSVSPGLTRPFFRGLFFIIP